MTGSYLDRSEKESGIRNQESAAPVHGSTFRFPRQIAYVIAVYVAAHLLFLAPSLEDIDSINFALGVRHYDVAEHQPHPPGYPLYILAAKLVNTVARSELASLAFLSILAGSLGILAAAAVMRQLSDGDRWRSIAATLVAISSPMYWFPSARPLSDVPGLAAVLGVQAMTLASTTPRALIASAFVAGLAAGLRSQVAWLTVPLLVLVAWRRGRQATALPLVHLLRVGVAFLIGVLVWFVPLVVVTAGPRAYWHALAFQGSADLGNIQMLWTRHGIRDVAEALYYAFVSPWASWEMASIVLVLAVAGAGVLVRTSPAALLTLAAAFGPYFAFDLLFQETFTSRYALPLVFPIAFPAAAGARALPASIGTLAIAVIAIADAHAGGTSVAAFAREKAPAFRLLDRMAADRPSQGPVLAMDRKQAFDFRRPLVWADGSLAFGRVLPAPPQHEWLEAMRYWNSGGRAPVWFVVDPKRSSIDLVQHGEPARYRWPLPYPVLAGGSRPDEMDWYRVEQPEWYVGEGWALTPEAAGVANADKRGLAYGPIHAGVHAATDVGGALMIGGRSFDPAATPRLTVSVDGAVVLDATLSPGPFLRFVRRKPDLLNTRNTYAALTVTTTPPAPVAIEQFDASVRRPLLGFGNGWHEQEFNPTTGLRWRWLSERGELKVMGWHDGFPVGERLHVEGESPRKYFSRPSHLKVSSGGRVYVDRLLTDDFAFDVPLETATDTIVLETDQIYVPADRSRRTQDRRHLGLRIYKASIR